MRKPLFARACVAVRLLSRSFLPLFSAITGARPCTPVIRRTASVNRRLIVQAAFLDNRANQVKKQSVKKTAFPLQFGSYIFTPPRHDSGSAWSRARKGLTKIVKPFSYAAFCSRRLISFVLGERNDVAFRCTTLTAEGHGRTNPSTSVANTLSSARQQTIGAPIRLNFSRNQRLQK